MMENELKEKIKKVMIDHLTEKGYPDIEPEVIFNELKPMWIKLEESGLVTNMTFRDFADQANQAFVLSQMKSVFGL